MVGDHTFEPVPFAVTTSEALLSKFNENYSIDNKSKLLLKDDNKYYDEISCAKGCLGRFVGSEVIKKQGSEHFFCYGSENVREISRPVAGHLDLYQSEYSWTYSDWYHENVFFFLGKSVLLPN